MIPEQVRNEAIEFREIGDVSDKDEIIAIEFRCVHPKDPPPGICDHLFGTIRMEGITPGWIGSVCQMQCSCGKDSGFRPSPDASADTTDQLELLTDLLVGLRHITIEKYRMIQQVLKGRNLNLRFGVKRALWSRAQSSV